MLFAGRVSLGISAEPYIHISLVLSVLSINYCPVSVVDLSVCIFSWSFRHCIGVLQAGFIPVYIQIDCFSLIKVEVTLFSCYVIRFILIFI